MSKVAELHKTISPKSVGIYIVTCSTSKFNQLKAGQKTDDVSGNVIEQLVKEAGHRVAGRELISDLTTMIRRTTKRALSSRDVDAVVITGGTGLSPRDVTVASVERFIDKEIPGFGELFRKISFDEIGPPAMLSRAMAGSSDGKLIFCLPGSPNGVRTALERLILPELGHMIKVCREH